MHSSVLFWTTILDLDFKVSPNAELKQSSWNYNKPELEMNKNINICKDLSHSAHFFSFIGISNIANSRRKGSLIDEAQVRTSVTQYKCITFTESDAWIRRCLSFLSLSWYTFFSTRSIFLLLPHLVSPELQGQHASERARLWHFGHIL